MDSQTKKELILRVDEALNTVRPHLAADGGDVEVIDVTDDMTVKVKWLGNCENCFMSIMTMKAGIEQAIKTKVPEIHHIEAINGVEIPG
ncbi:MAG: NifU family protein [Saprospiraceae bacterium]|jgi:Fe-S cluster biogenesis protein NfuA